MFSGLIEETGRVKAIDKSNAGWRIVISASKILSDAKVGDSISVSGACQTIERFSGNEFTIFSIPETLRVTNFAALDVGAVVNLERALALGDRLGGHLVLGHVEDVAEVESIETGDLCDIWINYDSEYIIHKGSVTLDGISLTIMERKSTRFRVQIIPETWKNTNISKWQKGTKVNIETDYIIKSLDQVIKNRQAR